MVRPSFEATHTVDPGLQHTLYFVIVVRRSTINPVSAAAEQPTLVPDALEPLRTYVEPCVKQLQPQPCISGKPKPDTVPAVPDVEPGSGGAWDEGILLQQQAKDPGPSTAAKASTSTAKEESTGLLKYFGGGKKDSEHTVRDAVYTHRYPISFSQTLSDAASQPPPKTLKQKFKGQKAFAGIGFLLSVLVLVTAFFHSGAHGQPLGSVCLLAFLCCHATLYHRRGNDTQHRCGSHGHAVMCALLFRLLAQHRHTRVLLFVRAVHALWRRNLYRQPHVAHQQLYVGNHVDNDSIYHRGVGVHRCTGRNRGYACLQVRVGGTRLMLYKVANNTLKCNTHSMSH